jgi:hypothetical protein
MNLLEHGVGEGGTLHEFIAGPLRISTVLQARPNADRLTVAMNAYYERRPWKGPSVFSGWPPTSDTLGHVLRVSDPTFFLDDQIERCAFLGTEEHDPIPPIVEYTRALASQLGIAPERVIYFGFSGAALGAARCALIDDCAIGIGANPSLEVRAYAALPPAKEYAQIFRPGAAMLDLCNEYPVRFSVTTAARHALAMGKVPRLGLIQNMTDLSHCRFHLGHFCREFGVPVTGGSDATGRFHAVLFDKEGGHAAVPDMPLVEPLMERLLHLPKEIRSNRVLGRETAL